MVLMSGLSMVIRLSWFSVAFKELRREIPVTLSYVSTGGMRRRAGRLEGFIYRENQC